jgi:sporulation protein YtfJ
MSEHPIQGLIDTAMEKIKQMVDANTIVGEPISTPDGTIIIPVSKVSFGFASGGSDFSPKSDKQLFGGGSGAGASISPIAFIIVSNGNVKLLQVSNEGTGIDRAVGIVPELFDKIAGLFDKKDKNKQKTTIIEDD